MKRGAVLVTGASSGIGLETAVHLADRGFQVFASMRDLSRRGKLDKRAAERNVHLEVLELDVTDQSSIHRSVRHIVEKHGGIYGVVNNAGINVAGFFEDLSDEEFRQVLEVNVFGTMAVTRAVLPYLRKARTGRVIIVGSIGGKIASPAAAAYCASKFALEGFSEALAQEMSALGAHVSLLEPGAVKTELFGRNRRRAARSLDPQGPYYQWTERLEELLAQLSESPATTLQEVARVVERALIARRPRIRYVVGRRPKLLLTLRRYLPGEMFERIWARETWRRIQAVGHS
jgi:NAD(P)-dependent dehydrogenase (short-subunit alcohol dehydrogenase family)